MTIKIIYYFVQLIVILFLRLEDTPVKSSDTDIWIAALYEKVYIFLENLKLYKNTPLKVQLPSLKNDNKNMQLFPYIEASEMLIVL